MDPDHGATGEPQPHDGAWLLLDRRAVPDRWAERARQVMLVPLLPEEAAEVLAAGSAISRLEPHEAELLKLIATGQPARVIASELGISQRAVERRLAGLRERFGVASTAELVAIAARHQP